MAGEQELSQKQLADRLGCDVMTVSRWELHKTAISTDALAALAEALGGDMMEPEDLYHHPDQPSPNQLLRDQSPAIQEQALSIIRAIRKPS
jgi:transcriptional regulator with XRE-family HTH domain